MMWDVCALNVDVDGVMNCAATGIQNVTYVVCLCRFPLLVFTNESPASKTCFVVMRRVYECGQFQFPLLD